MGLKGSGEKWIFLGFGGVVWGTKTDI